MISGGMFKKVKKRFFTYYIYTCKAILKFLFDLEYFVVLQLTWLNIQIIVF